jgi:hypothetical protein
MKSYDRMDGESAKAWAAFCVYRDLGVSRSLSSVAEIFYTPETHRKRPRNLSQIELWSRQWGWSDRV